MVGFSKSINRYREAVKNGIPILEGRDSTKDTILDTLGRHLAHILLTDIVFGSDFCGAIFAGMCIMNQCLLVQHGIHPTDIVGEAYRLLQE